MYIYYMVAYLGNIAESISIVLLTLVKDLRPCQVKDVAVCVSVVACVL